MKKIVKKVLVWINICSLQLYAWPVYALPQIVADGRTQTQLDVQGKVTDVTTRTIARGSGVNSFSKFDVYSGNTVNLHVPQGAGNLVNMVYDFKSHIDGLLNSYKEGKIGGNIYFLNPHGMVVGAQGKINMGSLHLAAPTPDFMEKFFTIDGRINERGLQQVIDNEIPLSSSGLIRVAGKIQGERQIGLRGGNIVVESGASIKLEDMVNTGGLQEATQIHRNEDGSIELLAQQDISLAGEVMARGQGENGSGGKVVAYAGNKASFEAGAVIDVSANRPKGDGGFIEFSAGETVELKGGQFLAESQGGRSGQVLIDPDSITISSDQLMSGADYSLIADESIIIADNVTISTRNIGSGSNQQSDISTGNSGNLELRSPSITVGDGAALLAHATGSHSAGNIGLIAESDTSTSITIGNALIQGGDITFTSSADTDRTLQNSNPVSTADARITLNTGARITSSGNMSLTASAAQGAPTINNGIFDARDSVARLILDGASLTAGGNVSISSNSSITTDLGAWLGDVNGQLAGLGVPFSFMVATTDSEATTTLQGATSISAGGSVDINSRAHTQSTVASQATSILAAATVGISDIENRAVTEVKGTTSVNSGSGYGVAIGAEGLALVDTIADANAVGSSGGSLAITVGYLDSDTRAEVSGGATVNSGGSLDIIANTINQMQNGSRAGITPSDDFIKSELSTALGSISALPIPQDIIDTLVDKVVDKVFERLSSDDEQGSDVQVAGAFSLGILDNDTLALLSGNSDKTITASGTLNVIGRSVTHAITLASGMSQGGAIGGGAGLAIQSANNSNQAIVRGENSSTLTLNTGGLSLGALTESYDDMVTEEDNNDFSTFAYSGQGGGDIGLAGALGVNLVDENLVQALLGNGVSLNAGGENLDVVAQNDSITFSVADGTGDSDAVDALFELYNGDDSMVQVLKQEMESGDTEDSGTSIGVGASLALDITKNETFATLSGGAQVSNVADITVSADAVSSHDVASGSAAEGGIAIVPLVSLIVSDDDTRALMEASSHAITATGDVEVSASQELSITSEASGEVGSDESMVAVGMSVDMNISYSKVRANIDRNITTSGQVSVSASAARSISSGATAAAEEEEEGAGEGTSEEEEEGASDGENSEEEEDDASVVETIISLIEYGNDLSSSDEETDAGDITDMASVDPDSSSEEEGESPTIAIAAVLGLNFVNADTMASIADNRTIDAHGGVSVEVADNTDVQVVSDGSTGGADANLGAAVSLNIVDVDLRAHVGDGAVIEAADDVLVQVAPLGVSVESEEDDEEEEEDQTSTFVSSAVAGAGQGNLSLAGAIAINVVSVDADAEVDDNASVTTTNNGDLTVDNTTDVLSMVFGEGVSGGVNTPTIEAAKETFLPFDKFEARIDDYTSNIGSAIRTGIEDAMAAELAQENINNAESDDGDDSDGGMAGEEEEEGEEAEDSIGIGAAFAINILTESTRAKLGQNSNITLAGALVVGAESLIETMTEASAGAGPEAGALDEEQTEAVGYSLDAAVALNILDYDTQARVESSTHNLSVGGDATIESRSEVINETLAHGEAAGESAAVGASVSLSVITADTEAFLGRNLSAGGALTVEADSESEDISDARATSRGLELEKYANKFKDARDQFEDEQGAQAVDEILEGDFSNDEGESPADMPHSVQALSDHGAQTQSVDQEGMGDSEQSDSISIAAAVGVNVLNYDASAETADGLTLSSVGALEITSNNQSNYNTRGTGIAILSDNAIAVGVGIANADNDTKAKIGDNTQIMGAGQITVSATSSQNQAEDFAEAFAAEGVAGAGAKKLGVAGALALVNNTNSTQAQVGMGTTVSNADGLTVESSDLSRLRAKAWGASVAVNSDGNSKAAIGAAFAVINTINETEAEIAEDSNITVTGNVVVEAQNLRQSEEDFDFSGDFDVLNPTAFLQTTNYYTEAIGIGATTGERGLAGSVGVVVSHNDIQAQIGARVTINSAGLDMDAKNRSNARSIVGAVAVGKSLAVGGSVSALVFRDDVMATVGDGASVTASGSVGINSTVEQDLGNIAFAGGVATNENALAGAASINVFDNESKVIVGTGSTLISSTDNLELAAQDDVSVDNFTGQGSYGGQSAFGGVLSLNLFLSETMSIVENNSILGAAGSLRVTADSSQDILNAAIGATGGGGQNALAGTLGLNTVKSETVAEVKSGSTLNNGNDAAGTSQSITVAATSDTDIAELIGAGAIGGQNGIGASLDTNVVWKETRAKLDGQANADTNIKVIADSEQDLTSAVVGFAGAGSVSVAGAGSIGIFKSTTEAIIGGNSDVVSKGNVQVHAEDDSDLVQLTGSASLSSSTALGGAIGVSTFIGRTIARIEDGAAVTALGNADAIDVVTGGVTYSSRLLGDLSNANVEGLRGLVESGLSAQTITNIKDSILGETKQTEQVRGLSVTATSDQDIANIASAGSVGGGNAAAGNLAATVIKANTKALIGDADINAANSSAHQDQQVILRAIADSNTVDFSGALAGGGGNALGGAGDVVVMDKDTKAQIAMGAMVNAQGDVEVAANAKERILSIAAGFAVGGSNTFGGSLGLGVMLNDTRAEIDGQVNSGGDLTVEARGESEVIQVAGSIAIGGGTVGVGASLGVSVFKNSTRALLGENAQTNARGMTRVKADSDETFYGVTVAGAGGGTVGVAGALSIRVHDSTTQAVVDGQVNQDSSFSSSTQSVQVQARNDLRELGVTGGLAGGGTAGVGLGADVVIVLNQANAAIDDGARVNAGGDIQIDAWAAKRAESYVLAFGGGGTVGVAGAVSVMVMGSVVDGDSKNRLSGSDDQGNSGSSWASADQQTGGSQVGSQLGDTDEAMESKTTLDDYGDDAAVTSAFDDTSSLQQDRTQAFIGAGAVVNAGRDITINSAEVTETRVGAGAIAASGGVSIGASIGIVLIDNTAEAFIGNSAQVNANRYLDIAADTEEELYTIAVAGGGAAYAAVNGSVIVQTILSDTYAFIDQNAQVNTNNNGNEEDDQRVTVKADSETKTFSMGGDAGGAIAGVGASVNVTTLAKDTRATIHSNADVRAESDVWLDALSLQDLFAVTVSAQGGVAGVGGVVSPQTINNTTEAKIAGMATVSTQGNVRVQAADDTELDIFPFAGQLGAVTVGGALGINTITSTTRALISGGASVTALGNKSAANVYNGTITTSESSVDAKTTTNDEGESETTSYMESELTRGTVARKGLAVIAQSNQDIFNVPVGFSAAATSYSATAMATTVATTTRAQVEDSATINSNNSAAGADQAIVVQAFDQTDIESVPVTGSFTVGGSTTLAANLDIIQKTVLAELGGEAQTRGDIAVGANTQENLNISVIDGAVSAGSSVGGAVALTVIINDVRARLRSGSNIKSGGDLLVEAGSDSSIEKIAGRGGAGGVAAVGAGLAIDVIRSRVKASIEGNATTNASGTTRVAALSRENFNAKAIAGSLAGGVALAGSFGVKVDLTTTEAFVGNGTQINQDSSFDSSVQDVEIDARNEVIVDGLSGAGAISLIGSVGLGVDLTIIRNTTTASTGQNVTIDAERDVLVQAQSERDIETVAIAGAGGIGVGVAGSLNLVSVGSKLDDEGKGELNNDNGDAVAAIDEQSSQDYVSDQNSGEKGQVSASEHRTANEDLSIMSSNTSGIGNYLNESSNASLDKTRAFIGGNSTVNAGEDISIIAEDSSKIDLISGGAAIGAGAVGGWFAVGISSTTAEAFSGDNVTLDADDEITIAGNIVKKDNDQSSVEAIGGSAGLLGFAGSVAILRMQSKALAYSGVSNTLTASDLTISARRELDIDVDVTGGAVGFFAAGVAISDVDISGGAQAYLGAQSNAGTQSNALSEASITSESEIIVDNHATAGAAGVGVALNGTFSTVTDRSENSAAVRDNANIWATASGNSSNIIIRARHTPRLAARGRGISVAGGIAVGINRAEVGESANVRAETYSGVGLNASGDINIEAELLASGRVADSQAMGTAGGFAIGAGATDALSRVNANVLAQSGSGNTITAGGDLILRVRDRGNAYSNVNGLNFGALAAGFNNAESRMETSARAILGASGTVNVGERLFLSADSENILSSQATAGAGGLGALVASGAKTSLSGQTRAQIADSTTAQRNTINSNETEMIANRRIQFDGATDSFRASVVGGSGARINNNITSNVSTDIGDYSDLTTEDMSLLAQNTASNDLFSGNNLVSGSGGVYDAAAGMLITNLNHNTRASVGDGVNISLVGDESDPGEVALNTFNSATLGDQSKMESGGAISIALTETETTYNSVGNVTVGNDVDINSLGDIVFGSRTLADIFTNTYVKTFGLAGAAEGVAISTINVTQDTTVGQDSSFRSERNIVLQAGTDGENENDLRAKARTKLWNKTAFPIVNDPEADAEIAQNNRVAINGGAQVRAVGDVVIHAENGLTSVDGYGEAQDPYRQIAEDVVNGIGSIFGADEVSFAIKTGRSIENSLSGVRIDGSIRASIENQESITFGQGFHGYGRSGSNLVLRTVDQNADGDWEVRSGNTVLRTLSPDQQSERISWRYRDRVNLQQQISNEINRLTDLKNSYNGFPNIQAAIQSEINRLTMEQSNIAPGTRVHIVEVHDVTVETGDIRLVGDYVEGSGGLTARGDAQIHITNNSPSYLRLGNLNIPHHQGGYIFMNNVRVEDNAEITRRSHGGQGQINFTITDRGDTPAPSIIVSNNFDPFNPADNVDNLPDLLAPEIQVQGNLDNLDGLVSLFNEVGSIISSGNINGDEVNITTGENFVQNYTAGIYHIGANPSSLLSNQSESYEDAAWDERFDYDSTRNGSLSPYSYDGSLSLPSDPSSLVAANNISIFAEVLNINGRIQSGLPNQTVTVNYSDADNSNVDAARSTYQTALANGQDVSSLKYYQITGEGSNLSEVDTFLNFETDEIEVGHTTVRGGLVQLTGKIVSTGNGRILVMDGYGRVSVDNQTGHNLLLRGVNTGENIEGKIIITDTGRMGAGGMSLQTTYTRIGNNLQIVDNTTVDSDGQANNVVSTSTGRQSSYNPQSGQRFNWILGSEEGVEVTDVHRHRVSQLGAINWDNDNLGNRVNRDTSSLSIAQLTDGGYVSNSSNANDYTFQYDRYRVSNRRRSRNSSSRCIRRSGLGALSFCTRVEVTTTTIYDEEWRNIYSHNINASRPVQIRFQGLNEGQINITSQGDVVIGGELNNTSGQTTITTQGDITQRLATATMRIDELTLNATSGSVGEIAQAIRLDRGNRAGGQADGALQVDANGEVVIDAINGDLVLGHIRSQSGGPVSLSADDDLLYGGQNASVQGGDIQLTSRFGGIGSTTDNVHLDAVGNDAKVSALAVGDIYLTEDNGNLMIDSIASSQGDVSLMVMSGDIMDANDGEVRDDLSESERMALYQEMRLMGSEATDSVSDAMENYREQKNRDYYDYWRIRGEGQVYNSQTEVTVSQMQREQLKIQNSWTDADVDAYQGRLTEQYHAAHIEFGSLPGFKQTEPDENYDYGLSAEEMQSFSSNNTSWSMGELSNTISAGAAVSTVLDAQAVVEESNIQGNDVILQVSGSVGNSINDIIIAVPQNGNIQLTDEIMEALRVAEKDDLIYDGNTLTIKRRNDLDVNASGNFEATIGDGLLLGSEQDLSIESITSTQEVRIKTEGGLSETGSGQSAVVAGNLTLESDDGMIGQDGQDFRVDVMEGSKFSARSEQDIRLDSSMTNLGLDEIITHNTLYLTSNDGNGIYDYQEDEEMDIVAGALVLTAQGDIGGRTSGGSELAGAEGALDVGIAANSQLMATSTDGIVNLNTADTQARVGQITAYEGAAVYSNTDIIVEGTLEVTNATDNMGAILGAGGEINGGADDGSGVMIAGDSGRVDLRAEEGIGQEYSLDVNASHLGVSNNGGNVSVVGERDIRVDNISQSGAGEIQIMSENNIVLGGGAISLGEANLNVTTEGNGELMVDGDMASNTGDISLISNQGIAFSDGVTITTRGSEGNVMLNANGEIQGHNLYLDTAGVHLISDTTSIGSSDQEFTVSTSGNYETLQAEQGIYLNDELNNLAISTVDDGAGQSRVRAQALGDWQVGNMDVGGNDLEVMVGGNSFRAEQLEAGEVMVGMTRSTGSADIGVVTVEDRLVTEAGRLSIDELRSSLAPPGDNALLGQNISTDSAVLSISSTGVGGGQAQSVQIVSNVSQHVEFTNLSTQHASLDFGQTERFSLIESNISNFLYLTTSEASFLLNQGGFDLRPANVLLYLPEGHLLNLEVDGPSYETSSVILTSALGLNGVSDYGGADSDSILKNTDRMGMQFMGEVVDILEEGSEELESEDDGKETKLFTGDGLGISQDAFGSGAEDIRNDFLRTIEVDRNSNSFFDESKKKSKKSKKSSRKK